jgi:AraC-like DNA-binding protein
MFPSLFNEAKLLHIERPYHSYTTAGVLPEEYLSLVLPYAGIYYMHNPNSDVLSQHVSLGPFSLWIHDIFTREDIVLCPFVPFPMLSLHFTFESSVQIKKPHSRYFRMEESTYNLLNLQTGIYHLPVPADTKVLSFHINIQMSCIHELVQTYPALSHYATVKNHPYGDTAINQYPHAVNAVSQLLIEHIIGCHYLGNEASRFLERCCLDLLLIFHRQHSARHHPITVAELLNMEVCHEVFLFLKSHPHKDFSIDTLAMIFDLPAHELESAFLYCFGISIPDYAHMLKMMLVYDLIVKRSFSMKEIADVAGLDIDVMIWNIEAYYKSPVPAIKN